MNLKTKDMIYSYYNSIISSQKLIQYPKTNESCSNDREYFNISKICPTCGSQRKYSGFKHGYRCTKECGYNRKIKKKETILFTKKSILDNITKQFFVSKKFLKTYSVTEKQCYDEVYGDKFCKYCNKESKFISWKHGYDEICSDIICIRIRRKHRTTKTNLEKYGVENVSSIKDIQERKTKTLFENYGVKNVRYLKRTQESIRKTNERNGRWLPYYKLADKKLYELKVRKLSEKQELSSLKHYNLRGVVEKDGYHLDHIYSISEGFKNYIPVHIISNINNLRFIPARENQSKNGRSDISINDLINKLS